MPPRTAMYLNDYDTSRLGLIVESVEGWLDAPSARDRVTQLPKRAGDIILAPEAETAPRALVVSGVVKRTSIAACLAGIAELKERCYAGTNEVRFVDDPERVVYARTERVELTGIAPQFVNPYQRVRIALMCPDPLIYGRTPTVVGIPLATTRVALPLGTAMSAPTIRVMGPATNPVLSIRRPDGTVVQTMGFTLSLLADDYLEIDCELFRATKYAAGVASNVINLWTSGDWLTFDPQDGAAASAIWPTIEVSAGSGEALYRKAYL